MIKHKAILEKYQIEIKFRSNLYSEEYLFSPKIPELIEALNQNDRDYEHLTKELIPLIKKVAKNEHPALIADWTGEGYFLNIYPNYVTSGFWYSDTDFDEEELDYRGKDTISMTDFLQILSFYVDFIEKKYAWPIDVLKKIKFQLKNYDFQNNSETKDVKTSYTIGKSYLLFQVSGDNLYYWFRFSEHLQKVECNIKKGNASSIFDAHSFYFEADFHGEIPAFFDILLKEIPFYHKYDFSTYRLESTAFDVQDFSFKSLQEMNNFKSKKHKSFHSGRFILKGLKEMIGMKNFKQVLDDLDFKPHRDAELHYSTKTKIELYFSIISISENLSQFEIWIISKQNNNRDLSISTSTLKKYYLTKN